MSRFALPVALALAAAVVFTPHSSLPAQEARVTVVSKAPFARVAQALEAAITAERMVLVCHADAQRGAAARGVSIKGNQVLMVFRNDFAVRLIQAEPVAAYEAPMRIYLYENTDGTATVVYTRPSAVLASYDHPDVRAVAAELDSIFSAIVSRALAAS